MDRNSNLYMARKPENEDGGWNGDSFAKRIRKQQELAGLEQKIL